MNTTKITNKEILEAIGTEYSKNNCVLFYFINFLDFVNHFT